MLKSIIFKRQIKFTSLPTYQIFNPDFENDIL